MPRSRSPSIDRHRSDSGRRSYRDSDRNSERDDRRGQGSSGARGRSRTRSPVRDREKGKEVDRRDSRREREREKSRSRSPARRRRRRSRSSSSSSSSDSDSGDDGGRRKRKSKRRSRSRSRSRDGSRERSKGDKERKRRKEEKRERRKRKEEKRAKRAAKKAKKSGAILEYGKYGILDESHINTKDSEFRAWLIEEKMLNPEVVPNPKMKELFKSFAEDWNTVTLKPKYYDLANHERKMQSIANGETLALQGEVYDFRMDEAAHARGSKAAPRKAPADDEMSHNALMELRRVQREREEGVQMKRRGLQGKQSLGVRYE